MPGPEHSVSVGSQTRTATNINDLLWLNRGESPPDQEGYEIFLQDPDGKVQVALCQPTELTQLTPFPIPDIRLLRLGELTLHELFNPIYFPEVRTTRFWKDKPLFAGEKEGHFVLLDGATRHGKLLTAFGQDASKLLVPVQIVDPHDLELDTWLDPSDRLTIQQVWDNFVHQGLFVKPRQTRFGVRIGGNIVVSVAETQPVLTFTHPLLPPHSDFPAYRT